MNEGRYLLGIDECGTGAVAGPFVVAGTVFPYGYALDEVRSKAGSLRPFRDSKKLSPKKREAIRPLIEERAIDHLVWFVFPKDIEKRGQGPAWQDAIIEILATLLQFLKVGEGIVYGDVDIMVDGTTNHILANRIQKEVQAGIRVYHGTKADETHFAVCAASILAKVARDNYMYNLHQQHPEYGWCSNVGYGTKGHMQALVVHGRTKYHRPLTKKWDLADR